MLLFAAVSLVSVIAGIELAKNPLAIAPFGLIFAISSALLYGMGRSGKLAGLGLQNRLLAIALFVGSLNLMLPEVAFGVVPSGQARNLALIFFVALGGLFSMSRQNESWFVWKHVWPYTLYALWFAFSSLWAPNMFFAVRDSANMMYPLLVFLMAYTAMRTATDADAVFAVLQKTLRLLGVISVCATAVFSTWMAAQGVFVWRYYFRIRDVPLTIHPVLGITIIVLELATGHNRKSRILHWGLIVGLGISVYLTLTRVYIAALLAGLFALAFFRLPRLRYRVAALVAALILATAMIVVDSPIKRRMFWEPDRIRLDNLPELLITGHLFAEEEMIYSGRLRYWDYIMTRARSHAPAWRGSGAGSARYFLLTSIFEAEPHGDYTRTISDTGYVGLALLALLFGMTAIWTWRAYFARRSPPTRRLAACVLFATAASVAVAGTAYDVLHQPYGTIAVAMVLAAIIHKASDIPRTQEAPAP